jgi:hypothetical protein
VNTNLERTFWLSQAEFEAKLEEAARLLEGRSYGVVAPYLVSEVALERALEEAAENMEDPLDPAGGYEHSNNTLSKSENHERVIEKNI